MIMFYFFASQEKQESLRLVADVRHCYSAMRNALDHSAIEDDPTYNNRYILRTDMCPHPSAASFTRGSNCVVVATNTEDESLSWYKISPAKKMDIFV